MLHNRSKAPKVSDFRNFLIHVPVPLPLFPLLTGLIPLPLTSPDFSVTTPPTPFRRVPTPTPTYYPLCLSRGESGGSSPAQTTVQEWLSDPSLLHRLLPRLLLLLITLPLGLVLDVSFRPDVDAHPGEHPTPLCTDPNPSCTDSSAQVPWSCTWAVQESGTRKTHGEDSTTTRVNCVPFGLNTSAVPDKVNHRHSA